MEKKIQPFSSSAEYAGDLAQTLRRAVGQLNVLTQTLALVEASEYDRRLLAEDYQERIFSHLERQVKGDV